MIEAKRCVIVGYNLFLNQVAIKSCIAGISPCALTFDSLLLKTTGSFFKSSVEAKKKSFVSHNSTLLITQKFSKSVDLTKFGCTLFNFFLHEKLVWLL